MATSAIQPPGISGFRVRAIPDTPWNSVTARLSASFSKDGGYVTVSAPGASHLSFVAVRSANGLKPACQLEPPEGL
jgi:hypothetical protein